MKQWQLQEAKARLSEVIKSSLDKGPQEITVRGRPAEVVVSKEDYERLKGSKPSLVEFLRSSPLKGVDLRLERNRTPTRSPKL